MSRTAPTLGYAYDAIPAQPSRADRIRSRRLAEPGISIQALAERFNCSDAAVRYALGLKRAGKKRGG